MIFENFTFSKLNPFQNRLVYIIQIHIVEICKSLDKHCGKKLVTLRFDNNKILHISNFIKNKENKFYQKI